MCVNNLPRVALDSREAGIQTHDLLIASPVPYIYRNDSEPHLPAVLAGEKKYQISKQEFLNRPCLSVC